MFKHIVEQSYPALYVISDQEKSAIQAAIHQDELVNLALQLGNIPSQSGQELQAAQFVHQWLLTQGFKAKMIGVTPERPNVIGEYGGHGTTGSNLLFNAHLDTESPTFDPQLDDLKYSKKTVALPDWTKCWIEDDVLHGFPITNDRGPMSCFLIAAKALKTAGIELDGKLYLTASPGEIGPEPIEEFQGVSYLGKEIGTQFLFNHGGVCPDYAVVAEGTDFGITWQASGYSLFKITLFGQGIFTPVLSHPDDLKEHPNPLHRLGFVTEALTEWAKAYELEFTYKSEAGTSIPKAHIDSIRAGLPHTFGAGTEICHVYLDVIIPPHLKASVIERSLKQCLNQLNIGKYEITPLLVRHGFEADHNVYPLVKSLNDATQTVFEKDIEPAHPVYSSMWRDHNVFNMNNIPAVTCGMPRDKPSASDMVNCAYLYALTMLSICGRYQGK